MSHKVFFCLFILATFLFISVEGFPKGVTARAPAPQVRTYAIKDTNIQFDLPDGWQIITTKENDDIIYVEKGGFTVSLFTLYRGTSYDAIEAGIKDQLKNIGASERQSKPIHGVQAGIDFTCTNGSGHVRGKPVEWFLCIMNGGATPVVRYDFGFSDVVSKHKQEKTQFNNSFKRISR